MNITTMTEIQSKTWDASVSGTQDVLGRSRTGSGKTLAFLVPSLERILRNQSATATATDTDTDSPSEHEERQKRVKMLIISPTRELAFQLSNTTLLLINKLGSVNNSTGNGSKNSTSATTLSMHCQVMYGGTPKAIDVQKMQRNVPTIITSTPGRLLDHLRTTTIHGNTPFVHYVKGIDVLVLDEMDLLLDMGFREDIQSILGFFNNGQKGGSSGKSITQRQTLLFSATLPHGVKDVIRKYLRPNHIVVDCIQDSDPTSHTVSTVDQSHVILPPNKMIAGIVQTVLELMKSNLQHKIIVFFPTTSQVTYFSYVFNIGLGRRVIEIHSGISQGARTNRSDNFRHSKTACVLFTSDVSARGVDYPDVTHVVQVGAASNRETYIHRLGRTGRAGKSGKGIIVLLPNEIDFIRRDLGDIDIPMNKQIQDKLRMDVNDCDDLGNCMNRIHDMTEKSNDMKLAAQDVYRSIFGYYAQRFKNMNVTNFQEAIIELVNGFAKQAGLREIPVLPAKVAAQYRLAQHPELNVQHKWEAGSRSFDVGRGGGGRGGAGAGNNRFNRDRPQRSNSGSTYRGGPKQRLDSVATPPSGTSATNTDWHGYL
jgi:ATP-dependent RNA helicase MSS116, mitochondrial